VSASRLAVWAPSPERVEVVLDGSHEPMRPGDDGWWHLDRDLPPGTDYAFSLDGGEPLPDPRSPWQPDGIAGPSRTVDHEAFAWTDGGWRAPPLGSGFIYELHIGTFTPGGTFASAIERLPDLAALGVTHVELMPVVEFGGDRGWGYDGVDLYAPHHAYGGPEGLKRFVDAAHGLGMAVLIDVVHNHLGPAGNHLQQFGPYFTDRYLTPWGSAVNFDDRGAEEVRRFFADSGLIWLRDYHADGLRLDAVHAIFDSSALHILEQLAREFTEFGRLPEGPAAPVDLGELLEELSRTSVPPTMRARLMLDPATPVIEGHYDPLRRAFSNILRNAVEACGGLGEIEITARPEGAGARISIRDHGPGIPPELEGRIFDPYCTGKAGGTGLGLALAKQTVEHHEGSIAVEPTPGGGATFLIELRTR